MINPGKMRWDSAIWGKRMALPWLPWCTWNLPTSSQLIQVYGCASLHWTGTLTACEFPELLVNIRVVF